MFPYIMTNSPVAEMTSCTLIDNPLLDCSQWSQGVTLSCGVNEGCDISTLIPHIVTGIVRRYSAHMPYAAWQQRCKDFLRRLEIMVGRKRSDGSPGAVASSAVAGVQSVQLKSVSSEGGGLGICTGDGIPSPEQSTKSAAVQEKRQSMVKRSISQGVACMLENDAGELQFVDDVHEPQKVARDSPPALPTTRPSADSVSSCETPKFEGTRLRTALIVQLMAESVHSCLQEQNAPPAVRTLFTTAVAVFDLVVLVCSDECTAVLMCVGMYVIILGLHPPNLLL